MTQSASRQFTRRTAHARSTKRRKSRDASISDYAKVSFEPWRHTENEWKPPSNDEWAAAANTVLVTSRFAWKFLYKTKDELVEAMDNLANTYPDPESLRSSAMEFIDSVRSSKSLFEGFVEMLAISEMRLRCALSAAVIRRESSSRRHPAAPAGARARP